MLASVGIEEIEDRLRQQGRTVALLCREAGIARSTWDRWARGQTAPNLKTWNVVVAAAERIAPINKDAA